MCQQPADRRVLGIFHDKRVAYFCVCYSEALLQPYSKSIRHSLGFRSPNNGRTFTSGHVQK